MSALPGQTDGSKPQAIPTPGQQLRPHTARAATLSTLSAFKGRATSQPPGGDRVPAHQANPDTGRSGSPGSNGNGGAYGVIGGSRTPGRFGGGLPGPSGMRAMSFSAAEARGIGVSAIFTHSLPAMSFRVRPPITTINGLMEFNGLLQ